MIGRSRTVSCDILGIPVSRLTMSGALKMVDRAVQTRSRLMIGVVNAAKIVNMRHDAALRTSVLSSDIILADGFSIVLAARMLGTPLPARITGIDLMEAILGRAVKRGYRVFCLGATADVLAAVERHIRATYPGTQLCGSHHGYFTPEEEPEIVRAICHSHADVLFVAMTSPKKECFLLRWGNELDVPVCHGVGGSFDVMAGKVRRAPASWQRLGLEWLYRVKQEPKRLWKRYLVTNSIFMAVLLVAVYGHISRRMSEAARLRGSA